MTTSLAPTPLADLLAHSAATEEFKQAVANLAAGKASGAALSFSRMSPPVKVVRTLSALLENEKDLHIATAKVDGYSGCSEFVGTVDVTLADGTKASFSFAWDCKWKAEQEGWKDELGFSDQGRAAREFGYRCMKSWERKS